eukprot:g1690.t1
MDDAIAMIIEARDNSTYDKIPDIVRAMEKYRGNEKLQYEATWTLMDFSCDDDANDKRIAKEGGIAAILRAMESHKTSEDVQQQGCGALCNLSVNAENQKRIAKEGGIAAILRAMESHKTSEGVQHYGCWALFSFASNAENQKRIAKEGGIAAILRAMESHKTSEDVQKQGCGALANLAANAENKKRIAKEGGIDAILRALQNFPTDTDVQKYGKRVLDTLQYDPATYVSPSTAANTASPAASSAAATTSTTVAPSIPVASSGSATKSSAPTVTSVVTNKTYDIFISYRRSRVAEARLLKDTLERLGSFKVFLDIVRDDGLSVGDFQSQLERVLRDTPVVVVMVTPAPAGPDQTSTGGIDRSRLSSMEHVKAYDNKGWTDWCRVEMATAVKLNKIIVPVYPGVEGGAFVGKELAHLQGLADVEAIRGKNAYPWHDGMYPESVQKIVNAVKTELAKNSAASFKGEMTVTRRNSSGGATKTVPLRLATSQFKQLYTAINATWRSSDYWNASDRTVKRRVSNLVSDFLEAYCKSKSIDKKSCEAFVDSLLEDVDDNLTTEHGHTTAEAMAVLLWTSAKTLRMGARKSELCSILNEIIRTDGGSPAFEGAVRLVSMIQHFLNASRRSAKFDITPGGPTAPKGQGWSTKLNTVYRGGSLPAKHLAFFKSLAGKDQYYRAAHLVATSFDERKAYKFAHRAASPKVLWIVEIDATLGCVNVNFIGNELTAVKNECEYLFSAYSAFKVVKVEESPTPEKWTTPHKIFLKAAPDNKLVDENVPTAPWC